MICRNFPALALRHLVTAVAMKSFMKKKIQKDNFDALWNRLNESQRDDFMLIIMAQSSILQLECRLGRLPTEQEVLDDLFEGGREYEDLRLKEARLTFILRDPVGPFQPWPGSEYPY